MHGHPRRDAHAAGRYSEPRLVSFRTFDATAIDGARGDALAAHCDLLLHTAPHLADFGADLGTRHLFGVEQ